MPTQTADGIFADTNVWVNAAVPTAPHHAQAIEALGRVAIGTLWTSRQVVREFLAVISRPQTFFAGNAPMPDILDRARTIESQCRVAEDGPDVAQQLHACLAGCRRYAGQADSRRQHRGDHDGPRYPDLAHGQRFRLRPLGTRHRRAPALA